MIPQSIEAVRPDISALLGDIIPERLRITNLYVADLNVVKEDIGKFLYFIRENGKGLV